MATNRKIFPKPTYTLSEVISASPSVAVAAIRVLPSIVNLGPLSQQMREKVMLAVSFANDCRYCIAAHVEFGRLLGFSEDEIFRLQQVGLQKTCRFSAEECAALEYAVDLVNNDFEAAESSLQENVGRYYSEPQIKSIEAAARVINLANRTGNTVDMMLARIKDEFEPRSDSSLPTEAILTWLWASVAAPVASVVLPLAVYNRLHKNR